MWILKQSCLSGVNANQICSLMWILLFRIIEGHGISQCITQCVCSLRDTFSHWCKRKWAVRSVISKFIRIFVKNAAKKNEIQPCLLIRSASAALSRFACSAPNRIAFSSVAFVIGNLSRGSWSVHLEKSTWSITVELHCIGQLLQNIRKMISLLIDEFIRHLSVSSISLSHIGLRYLILIKPLYAVIFH